MKHLGNERQSLRVSASRMSQAHQEICNRSHAFSCRIDLLQLGWRTSVLFRADKALVGQRFARLLVTNTWQGERVFSVRFMWRLRWDPRVTQALLNAHRIVSCTLCSFAGTARRAWSVGFYFFWAHFCWATFGTPIGNLPWRSPSTFTLRRKKAHSVEGRCI